MIVEIVQNGMFDSILSGARSIVSRKSSGSNISGSMENGSSERVVKGKISEEAGIELEIRSSTASSGRGKRGEIVKSSTVSVSRTDA